MILLGELTVQHCRLQNVLRASINFFPYLVHAGPGTEELHHFNVVVILWSGPCAGSKSSDQSSS